MASSRGGRSVVSIRTRKNYGRKIKPKSPWRGFVLLRNKYPGQRCFACQEPIHRRELIYWGKNTRNVVHNRCMSITVAKNALKTKK